MVLRTSNIDIPFIKGVNTKSDDNVTNSPDLLECVNRVFEKTGAVTKRPGYVSLGDKDTSGEFITNVFAVNTYDNSELMLAADSKIYSYVSSSEKWKSRGSFISATTTSNKIVQNNSEQTKIASATLNDVTLVVWEDSSGGLRYSLIDETDGNQISSNEVLDASGSNAQVIYSGSNLICMYGETNNLKYFRVPTGDPTSTPTTGTARTDLNSDHTFDLEAVTANEFSVVYKSSTATTMKIVKFGPTVSITDQATVSITVDDVIATTTFTGADTNPYLVIAVKESASLVTAHNYRSDTLALVNTATIDSTASADVNKIVAYRTTDTTDDTTFWMQTPGASNDLDLIKTNTYSIAGSAGTLTAFLRSVGIQSRVFSDVNGNRYLNVLHDSTLQSTVFTVDSLGNVIAKYSPGLSGTDDDSRFPVRVDEDRFIYNSVGSIKSESNLIYTLAGISKASIVFNESKAYLNAEINKELYYIGGILNSYDGKSITEQGFHLFPETITAPSTATSGGSMSDGTYSYVAIYQWIDNKGNLHRSAPSTPLSVTLSGGGSTQTNTIRIPTLRLTNKTSVTVEVYRTTDTGTIYRKATTFATPTDNDKTADTVDFVDTVSDSTLLANEIIYTTGGVLDNISAPSSKFITTFDNRVFLITNEGKLVYSKIVRTGFSVAFNEALEIAVDPDGGDITQVATFDSNLIIFKKSKLYSVQGSGPSDTGVDSTFTEPELIPSDVGCEDVNSIVLTPDGLQFKSEKGIYLLDRSLQVSYIGAGVEDFNDQTISSAVVVPEKNEVRYYSSAGITLVYNYFFKQWSTLDNQKVNDAVNWNGILVVAQTDNDIKKEVFTTFKDSDSFVTSSVRTGWVALGGIQGFQRAKRVSLLGTYKSNHRLRMNIRTDYSETIVQTIEWNIDTDLGITVYGDGSYGENSPYGGQEIIYQLQAHMKRQKCQSISIEVIDIIDTSEPATNLGEAAVWNGLTITVGTKEGINKVRSAKSK